ncbi:MAG: ABC transporter permease [Firmicutes bacterium]|nr:ABC transporter permease [Bacillota bacterium]
MLKVKNSRCISRISARSLKNSGTRNIIAVLAIALTALMITSLFTIGESAINSFQQSTMRQVGTSAHGGFKFLSMEQYDKVAKDPKVKDISYNIIVGNPVNPELKETYTELRYTQAKSAEWGFCTPQTGRLPKKGMELATTTAVLDALGVPHRLGAEVPLKFTANGRAYNEKFTLCGFWEVDSIAAANEAFVSEEYCRKVAPVWHDSELEENLEKAAYDSSCWAGSVNPSLWFATSWDIEGQMEDLKARCGFGKEVNEGVNWAYTTAEMDPVSALMMAGILLLIMLSGYLIIYNVFYISVSGDIRFYGLLKTIGTTGRQLKKIVRRQALLLSAIGIPLGLVLGHLAAMVLLPVVMEVMTMPECEIHASPLVFAGSALFALITVWISCIRPCRLASKIPPVEAVRFAEGASGGERKSQGKHQGRTSHHVSAISMAWGNLWRTPKKTVAVVLSISLSLIMLNSTVTVVKGFDMDKYIRNYVVSDFYVSDASAMNEYSSSPDYEGVSEVDADAFRELEGITGFGRVFMHETRKKLEGDELAEMKKIFDECSSLFQNETMVEELRSLVFEQKYMPSHVYGVDRFAAEKMELVDGSVDWEKFSTGKYVIASTFDDTGDTRYYEIGDKVRVDFGNGRSKVYKVMALGDVAYALGPQHGHGFDVYFTLPADEYLANVKSQGALKVAFDVDDAHYDEAAAFVDDYCENVNSDLDYRSRDSYVDDFRDGQRMYMVIGGALSFILALIGVLNFINGVVTSINARRRELAVLQSVGMTGKQLKSMLACEGAFHILLTAALVLTAGNVLTWGFVKLMSSQMWFFTYHFVIWPMVVSLVVFAVLAVAIPAVCCRRMCRSSIVDRLRIAE